MANYEVKGTGQVLQQADHRSAQGRRGLGRRRRDRAVQQRRPARSAPTRRSRPRARRSTWPTCSTPRAASSCSPTRRYYAVGSDKTAIAPFLLKKDAEDYAGKNGGKVLGLRRSVESRHQRRLTRGPIALKLATRAGNARPTSRRRRPRWLRRRRTPKAGAGPARSPVRLWLALHRRAAAGARDRCRSRCCCFCWRGICSPSIASSFHVRFINVPSPEAVFES